MMREMVGQAIERVACRRIVPQIIDGEMIEQLLPQRMEKRGKHRPEALDEPRMV
jgi:hypothetical protein